MPSSSQTTADQSDQPVERKTVEELAIELLTTGKSMTHGEADARRLLDELRKVWLNQGADFLKEIGTPIHGERTEHERGVMYASERLRGFGAGGAA